MFLFVRVFPLCLPLAKGRCRFLSRLGLHWCAVFFFKIHSYVYLTFWYQCGGNLEWSSKSHWSSKWSERAERLGLKCDFSNYLKMGVKIWWFLFCALNLPHLCSNCALLEISGHLERFRCVDTICCHRQSLNFFYFFLHCVIIIFNLI